MTKQEKEEMLEKLNAKLDRCHEYDIPDEAVIAQIRDIEQIEVEEDQDEEEVKVDAPFHGVLLLIKVNKEVINDALNHISNCPGLISDIHTVETF